MTECLNESEKPQHSTAQQSTDSQFQDNGKIVSTDLSSETAICITSENIQESSNLVVVDHSLLGSRPQPFKTTESDRNIRGAVVDYREGCGRPQPPTDNLEKARHKIASEAMIDNIAILITDQAKIKTRSMTRSGSTGILPSDKSNK